MSTAWAAGTRPTASDRTTAETSSHRSIVITPVSLEERRANGPMSGSNVSLLHRGQVPGKPPTNKNIYADRGQGKTQQTRGVRSIPHRSRGSSFLSQGLA